MDCIVIGSGPAGAAAALALLERGASVQVVDVGLRLEAERQQVVDRLARTPPTGWDPEGLGFLSQGADADAKGLALKRLFGSDFPYRRASESLGLELPEGSLKPSFALGGLSNTWGAVVLPYNDRDLEGWPIRAADLAPHYRRLGEHMPISAAEDALAAEYPIHVDSPQPPLPSRQAARLLAHLDRHRGRLERAGIRFGHARIAMRTADCRRCGMCLVGCPYDLILNTRQLLDRIRPEPQFRYLPGLVVRRIRECGDRIVVEAEDLETGATRELSADRCFVAAGVLATARIVLESLGGEDLPLTLLDSQHSILPLLGLRSVPDVDREELHTLCQVFLEVSDPRLSPHNINCQIYTYNNLFDGVLAKMAGGLARPRWMRRALLGRIMVALCYLHSDESGRIRLHLDRRRGGRPGTLVAELEESPRTARIMRGLGRKLLRHAGALGFAAAAPALHIPPPGRSFHVGGSFPMSGRPTDGQTDRWGRLPAWRRVHLVDASVFPTIPAATITYTVMANAHRIAAEAMES
jgi:choline dehydrogenase-like flavoprotein